MRTALVTGGNRGIGLEVCRALLARNVSVLLGSRDLGRGQEAAAQLRRETAAAGGLEAVPVELDLLAPSSIDRALQRLADDGVHIDILVNNAGVYPSGGLFDAPESAFREAMEVHFFGPLRLARGLVPAMVDADFGRVVNVSSGYGSFGEGLEGPAAYSLSKAALGALTVKLAAEAGPLVKVNAVCPGWVRTRMGGADAEISSAEGADSVVWLALLGEDGPTGGFFRERQRIPW